MDKHKDAGQPKTIKRGALKGSYFLIIDYLVNQYQGKSIENIAKAQRDLVSPVKHRGFPIDNNLIFGKLYPTMGFACIHADELEDDPVVTPAEEPKPKSKRKLQ